MLPYIQLQTELNDNRVVIQPLLQVSLCSEIEQRYAQIFELPIRQRAYLFLRHFIQRAHATLQQTQRQRKQANV